MYKNWKSDFNTNSIGRNILSGNNIFMNSVTKINPIITGVEKNVTYTSKILEHMLQDFLIGFDHLLDTRCYWVKLQLWHSGSTTPNTRV